MKRTLQQLSHDDAQRLRKNAQHQHDNVQEFDETYESVLPTAFGHLHGGSSMEIASPVSSPVSSTTTSPQPISGGKAVPAIGNHHDGSFRVYFAHKVAKLNEMHESSADEVVSNIFHKCIIYVNGITSPPKEEIRRLVTIHGGQCISYRVGVNSITHLVCDYYTDAQLKAEYSKVRSAEAKNARVYNVTAAWVTDSIKQGKRLSERTYCPEGLTGSRYGADIGAMFGQSSTSSSSSSSTNSGGDHKSTSTSTGTTIGNSIDNNTDNATGDGTVEVVYAAFDHSVPGHGGGCSQYQAHSISGRSVGDSTHKIVVDLSITPPVALPTEASHYAESVAASVPVTAAQSGYGINKKFAASMKPAVLTTQNKKKLTSRGIADSFALTKISNTDRMAHQQQKPNKNHKVTKANTTQNTNITSTSSSAEGGLIYKLSCSQEEFISRNIPPELQADAYQEMLDTKNREAAAGAVVVTTITSSSSSSSSSSSYISGRSRSTPASRCGVADFATATAAAVASALVASIDEDDDEECVIINDTHDKGADMAHERKHILESVIAYIHTRPVSVVAGNVAVAAAVAVDVLPTAGEVSVRMTEYFTTLIQTQSGAATVKTIELVPAGRDTSHDNISSNSHATSSSSSSSNSGSGGGFNGISKTATTLGYRSNSSDSGGEPRQAQPLQPPTQNVYNLLVDYALWLISDSRLDLVVLYLNCVKRVCVNLRCQCHCCDASDCGSGLKHAEEDRGCSMPQECVGLCIEVIAQWRELASDVISITLDEVERRFKTKNLVGLI